jgi:uncharacterized protein (TIGR02246 family)
MDGIDALVAAWTAAWNAHDMRAAAALVASDVEFVTVAGLWLRGRPEFHGHHERIHRGRMRDTTWTTHAHCARGVSNGLCLAHLEWTICGERDDDGAPCPPRRGIFTWIVRPQLAPWSIVAAHNTNLRADVARRLAPEGSHA